MLRLRLLVANRYIGKHQTWWQSRSPHPTDGRCVAIYMRVYIHYITYTIPIYKITNTNRLYIISAYVMHASSQTKQLHWLYI